ncbi:NUDIX domain-containing protein [Pseudorhizobium flavum]|uniref:NUDIX domain-containing protein n=1 Tax=Pseudorhizobium flavum TaxID=1335061 RepID=UPI000984B890|nr:NUDIX domain-containing protein [Pseudorhizobium flavum]
MRNTLFSGKILAVRAICLNEDNRIFLVKHTYTPGWHLPGGGVTNGMSVLETLEKELREEGNLRLASPPHLRQIFFNRDASAREHIVLYTVAVTQSGETGPSLEIAEGRFFPLHALPDDTDAATLRRIQEMRVGSFGTVW